MFIIPNQSRYLLEDPRRIDLDSMIWLHGNVVWRNFITDFC